MKHRPSKTPERAIRLFAITLAAVCCGVACQPAASTDESDPVSEAGEEELERLSDYGIECTLEPKTVAGGVRLTMTLENTGVDAVEVLPWNTAWDTNQEVLKVISPDGLRPNYVGAFEPHGEMGTAVLMKISPGDSISVDYPLTEQYEELAGELDVGLLSSVIGLRVEGKVKPLSHACGDVSYSLGGELGQHRALLSYDGTCTTSQQAELDQSLPILEKATFAASRHAERSTPLFEKYFGPWTTWKGGEVSWHYESTNGDWIEEPIRCGHASCGPTTLGLVPGGTDQIYLCMSQWGRRILSAGTSAEDWGTMVGTTVHEYSHATGIDRDGSDWSLGWTHGGLHPYETVDIVDVGQCLGGPNGNTCYGPLLTAALANDPTCSGSSATCKAMWNAGNYEFYAQEVYKNIILVTTVL